MQSTASRQALTFTCTLSAWRTTLLLACGRSSGRLERRGGQTSLTSDMEMTVKANAHGPGVQWVVTNNRSLHAQPSSQCHWGNAGSRINASAIASALDTKTTGVGDQKWTRMLRSTAHHLHGAVGSAGLLPLVRWSAPASDVVLLPGCDCGCSKQHPRARQGRCRRVSAQCHVSVWLRRVGNRSE